MKKYLYFLILTALLFWSCKQGQKEVSQETVLTKTLSTSIKTTTEITMDQKVYRAEQVVAEIEIPWGMDWLPDGSMLITDRSGILYHVKNGHKTSIKNVPEVFARNQGGLLDLKVHPNYNDNGWIYITYSVVDKKEKGSHTALIRAKLSGNTLTSIEKLYQAGPNTTTTRHFGSRIAFDKSGDVFFSIGDRGERDINPQDLSRDGGKIYRLHDDGSIPKDNPFVGQKNAKKAVFSYGHRNPQGMALNPNTGQIWIHEHGPRGGDEINRIKKGANYGWPVITYGINYSGTSITDERARDGMEQPLYYWVPSIAPSGMAFITSDVYPDLKGHLVVGSLKFQYLELLLLTKDQKVTARKKLLEDIGRLRSVRQGPDGYLYVGVDGKGVFRMVPDKENSGSLASNKTKVAAKIKTEESEESIPVFSQLATVEETLVSESMERGKSVYTNICMQCHLPNGKGISGVFPPLANSDWLTEKVKESIRSIKYGLKGEIQVNDKKYNGVMLSMGLTDQETADVMNYISNSWGNKTANFYTANAVRKVNKI